MKTVGVYYFEDKIAPRGYDVYKETWSKAPDGEVKVKVETSQSRPIRMCYSCVLRRNIPEESKQ